MQILNFIKQRRMGLMVSASFKTHPSNSLTKSKKYLYYILNLGGYMISSIKRLKNHFQKLMPNLQNSIGQKFSYKQLVRCNYKKGYYDRPSREAVNHDLIKTFKANTENYRLTFYFNNSFKNIKEAKITVELITNYVPNKGWKKYISDMDFENIRLCLNAFNKNLSLSKEVSIKELQDATIKTFTLKKVC